MLAKWVWPEVIEYSYSSTICKVSKVKEHSMVHDSYLCKRSFFGGAEPKPFPTRRETGKVPLVCLVDHLSFFPGAYNFVGAAGPMELKATCPEECRPPDHKDWTLCWGPLRSRCTCGGEEDLLYVFICSALHGAHFSCKNKSCKLFRRFYFELSLKISMWNMDLYNCLVSINMRCHTCLEATSEKQ